MTQERARQNAIQERKLNFTKNSDMLIVATHLGDHCVYLDVWELNSDGLWGIKTDYHRSFRLPPVSLPCVFAKEFLADRGNSGQPTTAISPPSSMIPCIAVPFFAPFLERCTP